MAEGSALKREVFLQLARGELTDHDEEQETLWSTVTSMVESLRDKLTGLVRSVLDQVLKLASTLMPAVSAVVSSVITLLTSLITLAIQYNSTAVKIALGTSILASLTAFISNIALLVKPLGQWDATLAQPAAVELTSHIIASISSQPDVVANALDFKTWVSLGITSLVAILFAGIGLTGSVAWRDLITGSNVLEGIKKSSNNIQSVANFILNDIVGIEMDKDYPQCLALEKLAEEGSRLQQLSVADFIQKPTELYKLRNYSAELIKVTAQKVSLESSRRYNSVRQLLIEIYRQLSQKLDAINAILATKPRQVTIGLMLSGPPGVGKSEFGKYISKRVAKALGYPTDLYCLNKKTDGFFEPYGGAALGVYNEFMALRSEDPILKDLNLILSSDPMNFEAACLEGKCQPCQLKLAFLTSNSHNPEVVRVLSESAVKAMWDRLYHISVEDPQCNGRHQPNEHRKPDFSHLKFHLIKHPSTDNIETYPTDLKTIEERLIGRCAMEERAYITHLLSVEQDEAVATSLMDRHRALGELLITCKPYDPIPNALGREFFVTRIQGIPGSGKSTLAEQLARACSNLFSMPVQYSRDETEFQPQSTPHIYVIDDWVEERNIESYVQLMNKTHERSMFFVTSNTEFKRIGFWNDMWGSSIRAAASLAGITMACPWDATKWDVPQGVLRRIGLQGFVRLPSGLTIQNPDMFQKTITCSENFVIRDAYGTIGHKEYILDSIFLHFRAFLAMPGEYCLIQGLPPTIREPAVTLEAPDAFTLLDGLRSPKKCMDAYMGRANGFKLLVADRLKGPTACSQTMVTSWMVSEKPSNDPIVLESEWARLCAVFNKTFPGEPLLLRLTKSGATYYYESGVAYYFNPEVVRQSVPVDIRDDCIVFYRDANTPITISFEQFAAARIYSQFDGPMRTCSLSEYKAINRAFTALMSTNADSLMVKRYLAEEARSHSKYSSTALWWRAELRKSPIFWIGVSLISFMCVGGVLYSFIKVCQTIHYYFTQSSVTTSNTSPPVETRGHQPARQVLNRLTQRLKPNSDPPRETRGFKHAQVALRRFTQPRANNYDIDTDMEYPPHWSRAEAVLQALKEKEKSGRHAEFALKELLNDNPDWVKLCEIHPMLDYAYSNMLRTEDMVKSPPSGMEIFHSTLKKAYVHISSERGSCYAIHLKDGYFLTVSHLFDSIDMPCLIRNDGETYDGEVVLLDRDRDLSVIRVLSKQFPSLPNTRRYFAAAEDIAQSRYGFFLRCGPGCQAMGGLVSYYDSTYSPITSKDNKNYQLSSKLIVHIAAALENTRHFIRMGDCGFPLVSEGPNGLRITGIHNGYNQTEKSYYSSFSTVDFDDFTQRASVTPNLRPTYKPGDDDLLAYELVDQDHAGLLPKAMADALNDIEEDYQYPHYHDTLNILGWSSRLALRSVPKGAHKPIQLPNFKTERLTLPAAFTMDYVEDVSALAVKAVGTSSPLFTQCLKYDARVEPSFDPYIFEEATGIVMQDCVSRYGGCRILRLHETVNGIPGHSLPPIETRTSGGPLLKMLFGVSTKAPLFEVVSPEKGRPTLVFRRDYPPAVMVRNHYHQYMNSLLENKLPPILISKDCAKVELIDADKASKGKVRLFNEVDFSINLVLRSVFGDFASKVMDQHLTSPIRMGQDPYVAATAICRQFNEILGNVVSTDFSSFDKQLPLELIYSFCWIISRCMTGTKLPQTELDEIFYALARSLTYVFHTCGGIIYLVDRGNESGTFVTTLLNSVSVDVLTTYTLCRKWLFTFRYVPSHHELSTNTRKAILGDDRSLKVSPLLDVTQEDLITDSKLFGLKCTPAKTESGLDFCSRALVWDPVKQISYPALKVSSVTSQLHWTTSFSEEQLLQNCDNALFEAALHSDPQLFSDCLDDALAILSQYRIPCEKLSFHSRDIIRFRFETYVRNAGKSSPYVDQQIQKEYENPVTYVSKMRRAYSILREKGKLRMLEAVGLYDQLCRELSSNNLDFYNFTENFTYEYILNDPKSYMLQFLQNYALSNRPEVTFTCDSTGFNCNLHLYGRDVLAHAPTKKLAEKRAYLLLVKRYFPPFSNKGARCEDKTLCDISENIE